MKKILMIAMIFFAIKTVNAQVRYEKSIELFGGPALNDYSKYTLGASTTHGARIGNVFFVGAGVGFRYTNALYYSSYRSYRQFGSVQSESYDSFDAKYLIPFYFRASFRFSSSSIMPILSFDIGTTIDVGQNQEYKNIEGLFYEPAIGFNIMVGENTSMLIAVGLNYQSAHYTYYSIDYYSGTSTEEKKGMASTLNIKIGLMF